MLKKIILSLAFFYLLLIIPRPSFAQESSFLVPGVNCGIAGDVATSKCCAPVDFLKQLESPPDFGSPFRVLRDLLIGPGLEYFRTKMNPIQQFQKKIVIPCQTGVQSTADPSDLNCRCTFDGVTPTASAVDYLYKFCAHQTGSADVSACNSCVGGGGVWTGVGCVQGTVSKFIGETVFGWGIGLAGGFSLLCIIFGAFQMQSSQGNPERLKKAQEMITSCIMGLMLIIFSVFILRLIGVNILRIPGFI